MSSTAREIKSLWDLINAGSYKQALVKVNKEVKKSPNHPYWLALNGYITAKQNKQDDALKLAGKVAAMGPTNLTVLSLLQEIFVKYGKDAELCSIFEVAVRKSSTAGTPVDAELLEMWIDSMLDMGYIKGFVQCSMAKQKATQTRASTLQAALAMYLSCCGIEGRNASASDSEKNIFPILALRMLQKIEPMENAQEGYVYALVLAMPGTEASLDSQIDYLQSDRVKKWESLDLILLLLKSLENGGKWEKLLEECKELLTFKDGQYSLDNWLYWEALVKATIKLGDGKIEDTSEFIGSFTPSSRNSQLAKVDLYAHSMDSRFMESIKCYFTSLGNKRCAYEDLKKYVEFNHFKADEFLNWLHSLNTPDASLDWKLNTAKFDVLLLKDESTTIDSLIKSYNASKPLLNGKDPKDYFTGDDLLLIANSKLLAIANDDPYALEKSALLLETASLSDKHQFYVRLWLVRLYLLLGSFVKAQGHYDSLAIKMIQNENISHSLLTRCATLHPTRDVIVRTNDIYTQLAEITPYTKYALTKASYTQVEGFIDLNRKLKTSLNRQLINIEEIKIQRLLDPSGNANLSKLEEDFDCSPESYSDNRDFSTIANTDFQPLHTRPLSEVLTIGPKQGTIWAKAFVLRENIIRRLLNPDQSALIKLAIELKSLYPASDEFTKEEKWSLELVDLLVSCTLDKASSKSYAGISTKLSELPISTSINWHYLHRSLTVLETCKIVSGFLSRLRASRHQFKIHIDAINQLVDLIKKIADQIHESALEIKNSRNKRYQKAIEALGPWAEERGIPSSLVENVLDGIGVTQDKSLTLLRSISV